jgi:phosphoglycolate phosphatase-like HAD superfamily hydrolase
MPGASTLVLFDIDLTLLEFGTDRDVLRQVIAQLTDDPDLRRLDPTGRSDGWVVSRLAAGAGETVEALLPRYQAKYRTQLEVALARDAASPLPGAVPLLERLVGSDGVSLAIATGNLRANAELKLGSAGLAGFFEPLRGGFGDHASDRAGIVAAALVDCGVTEDPVTVERVVLLGDTQLDMSAAARNGVIPIGVATGRYSVQRLRDAGAAAVYRDLVDTERVADAILSARM